MSDDLDDLVKKVSAAIDGVQLWWRYNNWTDDRVKGKPIEVCRHGKDGEEEIVVVDRFWGHVDDGDERLHEVVSLQRAKAAILAMNKATD